MIPASADKLPLEACGGLPVVHNRLFDLYYHPTNQEYSILLLLPPARTAALADPWVSTHRDLSIMRIKFGNAL